MTREIWAKLRKTRATMGWGILCWCLLACASSAEDPPRLGPEAPRSAAPSKAPAARPHAGVARLASVQQAPVSRDVEAVLAAQRALAPYVIEVVDPPDVYRIPQAARPLLSTLHRALFTYIEARLPGLLAAPHTGGDALGKALRGPLEHGGVRSGFESQSFGSLLGIHVSLHPGALVGVVIAVSASCGSDSTLFLFSTQTPQLRHVLTAAAGRRRSLRDAQFGLDYALLPSPQGGDPEVVVAFVNPWCSSAWRTLNYAVLTPTRDPWKPKRRLEREDSVWIGNGFARLDAGPGWFELGYDSWDTVGGNVVAPKRTRFEARASGWTPVPTLR